MIDRPNAAVTFVIVSSTPSPSIMFLASISSGLRIALWSFSAGAGAWFGKRKLLYSLHFDKGERGWILRSSSSGASYENSKDSQLCKSLGIQSNQKTKWTGVATKQITEGKKESITLQCASYMNTNSHGLLMNPAKIAVASCIMFFRQQTYLEAPATFRFSKFNMHQGK